MNFYDYYQPGESLEEPAVYLAAKELISKGFQVIPIVKGEKAPANIKDVYKLLSNPIHDHNINYYFRDRDVDIGLILTDEMEFLDIDEKYKPGITSRFLKALEFSWPELYEKLVIHHTKTGGCHLLYRSEVIGGKKILAQTPKNPNPLAIIERISKSNTQYIKIPPSDGYRLFKGSPLDIKSITAEERNWLSALAMSFNEVHIPEVKQKEAEREDSPWYVFNEQKDWRYIREQLIDRNWSIVGDYPDKVIVKRPGDSAGHRSSGYIYKDNNTLYLHTTSTEFENGKAYSPFGVYCLFYHDNNIALACRELAASGVGKNILDEGQFWKKNKSKIEIKYTELLNWFHGIGYRKYKGSIVQIIDNIVTITDEGAMKRAFIHEVEFQMQDAMYERVPTIFSEGGGLMSMLNELDDNFINDTSEFTWLFFDNIAIRISGDKIEPFAYKDLNGYIWKSDIIHRYFYESDYDSCDADRFVGILGGEKKKDLKEIIGYSISRYKDPLNPRAIIIMEDIDAEDEGESQGGSGKGLLFNFIKQFRKSADFDGKSFRPQDPFLYQNIEPDTSIIFIDDVERHFKFNTLFSVLTSSLLINKKNKPQIIIPFERSPKIFITSNYSVGGMDLSSIRRKYEFAVVKYFGEDKEPIDEFGRQFFSGWDSKEWLRFDNFIASCCKLYLAESKKKTIGNVTVNSKERTLVSNTNKEFVEYMDGQLHSNFFDFAPLSLKNFSAYFGKNYVTNAVNIEQFKLVRNKVEYYFLLSKKEFSDTIIKLVNYKGITPTRVTQWLKRWADVRGVEIDLSYKRGMAGERCYRIINWEFTLFQTKPDEEPKKSEYGWKPNENSELFS
jgi:hypothetical protein